jgi:hypothetical protein
MSVIRVNVVLPVLRLGAGPFTFDPFEQLVGAKISHYLEPLMTGPMTQRRTEDGLLVDVYALALLEGEGASFPMGATEVGFFNDGGTLVLTVPVLVAPLVVARLGTALVRPPRAVGSVVEVPVQLRAGSRVSFPVGRLGEIAVEATSPVQ